jgi:site-specific DNA-cytosine methylase
MIIFDLFSGTGSATKAFEEAGHTIISFEMNPKQLATENVDVMTLNAKDLIAKYGRPDFVWASPPCTTFSVASCYKYWEKTATGAVPKHPDVFKAIELVRHTINLIQELNPTYGWLMENPRGMLRKQDVVKDLTRRTITYCQYGDFRMKPTDLWGHVPGWVPRPMCKNGMPCHEGAPAGTATGSTRLSKVMRSMIPYELSKEILDVIS